MSKKIIVTSTNPVKIKATELGFSRMFPDEKFELESVSVQSGVSDQPMSDKEAFEGALNRVNHAMKQFPNAEFWVGIEGGVELINEEMKSFAWVVIKSKSGLVGKGRTGTFFLPKRVVDLIIAGKELGEADDIVFGLKNSKQVNGAVGILTGDVLTRTTFYEPAVILALIPFKNTNLY